MIKLLFSYEIRSNNCETMIKEWNRNDINVYIILMTVTI